jgi:hydroxyacylglutathione hydrolase
MTLFTVHAVPVLEDNYVWLLQANGSQSVIVIDPGDAEPVIAFIRQQNLVPVAILVTHHHYDHVDGIQPFLAQYPVPIFGPGGESIPGMTQPLSATDNLSIHADFPDCQVIAVPGHTHGHIAYKINDCLFCGDTLFAAGCGRLLGGTHAQLLASLKDISTLPLETKIYCAHEYTVANLKFARTVEPNNIETQQRLQQSTQCRVQGHITLPSTLDLELATNPFLRCQELSVINSVEQHVSRDLDDELAVFTALRQWKDSF